MNETIMMVSKNYFDRRIFVLFGIISLFLMGMVGCASGEVHYLNSTILNSDTTRYVIDQPGVYIFDEDIIDLEFPCDTSGNFNDGYPLIWILSSDVTIEGNGHRLDGIDNDNGISAIIIGNCYDFSEIVTYSNVTVRNLIFSDWYTGIESHTLVDSIFEYNSMLDCGLGISVNDQLYSPSNPTVRMNTIENGDAGITVAGDTIGIVVENNKISGMNGHGISVGYGIDPLVIGNTVVDCDNTGIECVESEGGRISDNVVTGCGDGITTLGYDMEIVNNIGSNNQVGLILSSGYSTVRDNIFQGNSQYGILIDQGDESHIFNNYLNNSENVYLPEEWDLQCSWNTSEPISGQNVILGPYIGGNYWGKPDGSGHSQTATDQDGDGFTDEFYIVYSHYVDIEGDGTTEYVEDIDYFPLIAFGQSSENLPPVIEPIGDKTANEGEILEFTVSASDPEGQPLTYSWDFGDGETGSGVNVEHIYSEDGEYLVILTVSDPNDETDTATANVVISNVVPVVDAGLDQETCVGETVVFSGSFTDPGTEDTHTITWTFGDGESAEGASETTHVYTDVGVFTATMTVTDDDGGVGQDSIDITVKPIPAIVNIDPESLNLGSNGVITAFISLTEGYDGKTIDYTTVTCEGIPATKGMICDEDQYDYQVKFDRDDFTELPVGDAVTLTVKGKFICNGCSIDFEGTDVIKIMNNGNGNKNQDQNEKSKK